MTPFLAELPLYTSIPLILILFFILGYKGAPNFIWAIASVIITAGFCPHIVGPAVVLLVWLPFLIPALRTALISKPIMNFLGKIGMLPAISQTEREAIDAGTVWVEKEFFSGKPNIANIMGQDYPSLTADEQAFLDGPVQELCEMVRDYDVACKGDIPEEAWDYIKKKGFFSFIIDKQYGGLKFSALAVSTICAKLSSHCSPLGITVMVPNSLGPAELLQHYGTEKQKDHYLPRLADGREIPCFALTEPTAGSDAGSITAHGIVYKHENGELYMRLNFKKRYITLAAISTVMGLAFKLDDPENLLGKGTSLGITCALIPSNATGVRLGRRHDPLGCSFFNCPINGVDVEVSVEDCVIGGAEGVGRGWGMLMNCLSAGRAITLPATSTGLSKLCTRTVGAYAKVRKQFGISIGLFEGIDEVMAEIGGHNYLLDATRIYTAGGVDNGEKPSVVSALAKYHFTEIGRESINHAMDICGGAGISRGPNNILANAYTSTPIGITVEGANILTRTMIIFGQGLIRCHPYAMDEVNAIESNDYKAFDHALWKHAGFAIRNKFRAVGLTMTRGWLAPVPSGPLAKYWRKITWASAVYSVLSEMAMGLYGGNLKRKEKMTGRLGDMVSWMYMASCTIKRFEHEGRQKEHLPYALWALDRCMQNLQTALEDVLQNFKIPVIGPIVNGPLRAFFRFNSLGSGPSDSLGTKVAKSMMKEGPTRDAMTVNMYLASDRSFGLGRLEQAFELDTQADPILKKIKSAVAKGTLKKQGPLETFEEAMQHSVINHEEKVLMKKAYDHCIEAIQVDEFGLDDYVNKRFPKAIPQED